MKPTLCIPLALCLLLPTLLTGCDPKATPTKVNPTEATPAKVSSAEAISLKTTPAEAIPTEANAPKANSPVASPTEPEKFPLADVQIASNGKPLMQIVLVNKPTKDEERAAKELADYLEKITGGTFAIVPDAAADPQAKAIQVGNTAKAQANGVDASTFEAEQWTVQARGGNLYLNGGRPRGALYAVYHFLEDQCSVRWWSPWAETVPANANLKAPGINASGKPAFADREIYQWAPDVATRNRLTAPTVPGIGGFSEEYARPMGANFVHSNSFYINPDTYFGQHPEWFSANAAGGRVTNGQLCLTNPEMRQQYLTNLLKAIAQVKATAAKAGIPPATVFDISQNDNERFCHCKTCSAIAETEGSQAGPIIDFAKWMADEVVPKYPDVKLSVLAYQYSEYPPKTLAPRSSVVVRLCDTMSNFLLPTTAPDNVVFKDKIDGWSAKASGIHIWKYIRTHNSFGTAPIPNLRALRDDFLYYRDHHVTSIFCEHEIPLLLDMWEYKNWMLAKFLEKPEADFDTLRADFCNGFYGGGGAKIIAYLDLLERRVTETKSFVHWLTLPEHTAHLDQDFYDKAQSLFDVGVTAAAGDELALRRIKQARIPLDRSQVYLITLGKVQGDKAALATRYRAASYDRIEMSVAPVNQPSEKFKIDADCDKQLRTVTYIPEPANIPGVTPADAVLDQHAASGIANVCVPDSTAPSGYAIKWAVSAPDDAKYQLPMPFGLHSPDGSGGTKIDLTLTAADIPGPGYHWYRIGEGRVNASSYVWATWPWLLQIRFETLLDPAASNQVYEVWASIKLEGPKFLGEANKQPNAVYLERAALVKKSTPTAP